MASSFLIHVTAFLPQWSGVRGGALRAPPPDSCSTATTSTSSPTCSGAVHVPCKIVAPHSPFDLPLGALETALTSPIWIVAADEQLDVAVPVYSVLFFATASTVRCFATGRKSYSSLLLLAKRRP